MTRHRLAAELWLPTPIAEIWQFMSDAKNLVTISPKFYGIEVETDGLSQNGSRVAIRLSPYGIPLNLKWDSLISDVIDSGPERQFIDTQVKGPFAYWQHRHNFREGTANFTGARPESPLNPHHAGTWLKDEVEYELPAGPLGEIAHRIYIRRSLGEMFWHRSQALRKIFN